MRVLFLLLLLLAACDEFLPDREFEPSGTPFRLEPGLALVSITGGPRPVPTGTFTVDVTLRATGNEPVSQLFPAGLLFASTQRRVQHTIVLKDQRADFGPDGTRRPVGIFCCNRYRLMPDESHSFDLGPFTDNRELREIAALIRDRDVSAPNDLWLVQRAVWMVTDSIGLNQAYRDSLAALPSE